MHMLSKNKLFIYYILKLFHCQRSPRLVRFNFVSFSYTFVALRCFIVTQVRPFPHTKHLYQHIKATFYNTKFLSRCIYHKPYSGHIALKKAIPSHLARKLQYNSAGHHFISCILIKIQKRGAAYGFSKNRRAGAAAGKH